MIGGQPPNPRDILRQKKTGAVSAPRHDVVAVVRWLRQLTRAATWIGASCMLAAPLHAEEITLRTVDFDLPLPMEVPKGTDPADVFVSDTLCFYLREDLSFKFIGCVG